MASFKARILILCKTYPSPSGKHVETSCVAGLTEDKRLIRLFPVPFRLINDGKQFRKWQWITARIEKAKGDHRPESHKIFVDTIECDPRELPTRNGWAARRAALAGMPVFDSFAALDQAREAEGQTLGVVKPHKILGLDIAPVDNAEWTPAEREKLEQNERQIGLFDSADQKSLATLRKLPFSFYYRYESVVDGKLEQSRHKIADWEIGALFWKCKQRYGDDWESPFRQKMVDDLTSKDLSFLMGTIHRFPDQWLIVSLIYPPKQEMPISGQQSLLL
ncbi:MAG: hypothetical protein IBJ12_04125 [Sphingomonadaceae bacterium]|nr:hypothetical protein [Sphingomonadaceae bacterium]